jgi:DNA-binding transcriptional LysR family regulator
MNLGHLAIFHAVATFGNVSRAADRLMISQPAVSKQLAILERALATTLFERLPKGMRLTSAGELLEEYAARIFALETQAEEAIAELKGVRRGSLIIGASNTIGVYLLPDVLVRFRQKFPGVRVQLEIAHTEAVTRWLRRGDVQLAFVESVPGSNEVAISTFARDRLVAIAGPRHSLARRHSLDLATLCREKFIVRETGSGTKSLVERTLEEKGLAIDPVMSLGSTEAIKRAVAAGMGVAIVSELSAAVELEARRLVKLKVKDLQLTRPLYRITQKGGHDGPAAVAFLPMLQQAVAHRS